MSTAGVTGPSEQPEGTEQNHTGHTSPTTNPATLNQKVKSCILCQQRKVRCDRKSPCSVCTKARVECIFRAPIRPGRRSKKNPEADLLARLRKYEDLLKTNGIEVDDFENEGHHSENATPTGAQETSKAPLPTGPKREKRSPEMQRGRLIVEQGVPRYIDK